jgi:hypothetical protein
VDATVGRVIRAIAQRHVSVCTRLLTAHYVEVNTGLKGGAGLRRCQQGVRAFQGTFTLRKIEGVRVAGDLAFAQYVALQGGRLARQLMLLRRVGGGWRMDSGTLPVRWR